MPLAAPDLTAVALAGVSGAIGGLLVPRVLARLARSSNSHAPVDGQESADRAAFAQLAGTTGLGTGCALAAAAGSVVVAWHLGSAAVLAAWVYLSVVGVLLGLVDWRTRLLPTAVIAPSYAVVAAILAVASGVDGSWDNAVRAGLGWLAAGGFFFALWLVHPRGIGYGDVRLSGLLGMALAWLGWAELVVGIYAGFCLGAAGGALLSLLRLVDRRGYPFGPFMLLGALVGLLWGPAVGRWYAGG